MKILILFEFLILFAFAQEANLDNLLKKYQDSESLYKKTKQENAGFLLLYSREDLEAMQVFTLKDIIKTVRMFNMQLNPVRFETLTKSGAGSKSIDPIKLYIDDFEVIPMMQTSPIEIYFDMDLYFVDHVEIYQGGSSIVFGNEPGSMVIRLYSKDPSRENSCSFQVGTDSFGSKNLRVVDAKKMGEYNYLAYASVAQTKYDILHLNESALSRDSIKYQAHLKFSQKNNFDIEFDGILKEDDAFKGFGTHPQDYNYVNHSYAYLSATKYFENNLKISFSVSGENKKAQIDDKVGFISSKGLLTKRFYTDMYSKIYKAVIEKKLTYNNHSMLIGGQYLKKKINIKSYKLDNTETIFKLNKLDIYMMYLEEEYNINKNNLLSFGVKLDHYENNLKNSSDEYSLRLAYIGILNDNIKTKIFAIRRYVYPNGTQIYYAMPTYNANPNLKNAIPKTLAGEIEHNNDTNRFVLGLARRETDNAMAFDNTKKMYINSSDTSSYNRIYLRDEYKFDINNKIVT